MRIIISGRVAVHSRGTGKEITAAGSLKKLKGLFYDRKPFAERLRGTALGGLGLRGGAVRLAWDGQARRLRVISEYAAPRKLTATEARALADVTVGEWLGTTCARWLAEHEGRAGVVIDLSPSDQKNPPRVEQRADKAAPGGRRSPLLRAALDGDLETIRKLLGRGEDLNPRGEGRRTPLHLATLFDQTPAALYLIRMGADVNAANAGGETPLHLAAKCQNVRVARALLGAGAAVDAADREGRTPLMWAAAHGKVPLLLLLLQCGADPNRQDRVRYNGGKTALMYASPYPYLVVEWLLEYGADLSVRDRQGLTAWEEALDQAAYREEEGERRYATALRCKAAWLQAAARRRPHTPSGRRGKSASPTG
jgi:hypothetical protein